MLTFDDRLMELVEKREDILPICSMDCAYKNAVYCMHDLHEITPSSNQCVHLIRTFKRNPRF